MEYLQYKLEIELKELEKQGFKPYYKWNTFNTSKEENMKSLGVVF